MRITTEASLRRIVRRIISEAKDTKETVTVTNSMKGVITVTGVYSATDIDKVNNLLSTPAPAAFSTNAAVEFTPTTDDTAFKIIATRYQGTGATRGYSRGQLSVNYTIGDGTVNFDTSTTGSVAGTDKDPNPDYSDDEEMDQEVILELLQPGEKYLTIEDPTDPEFQYAVVYKPMPTRAIVVRAPSADYKGDKIVSSKGQEISPRRYGGSFKKIADAFIKEMNDNGPLGNFAFG